MFEPVLKHKRAIFRLFLHLLPLLNKLRTFEWGGYANIFEEFKLKWIQKQKTHQIGRFSMVG
jgi:hypothetical protein